MPSQPSEIVPQSAPTAAQLLGVHPHWFALQTSGKVQLPHTISLPQPSEIVPHAAPCSAQVFGVQPQAFARPVPPHVSGALHTPHSSKAPQVSLT